MSEQDEFEKDAEIVAAATPGPWVPDETGGGIRAEIYRGRKLKTDDGSLGTEAFPVLINVIGWPETRWDFLNEPERNANKKFVVRARTRWPAALAEIKRLRTDNDRLGKLSTDMTRECNEMLRERNRFRSMLPQTADGVLEDECRKFYCWCGMELRGPLWPMKCSACDSYSALKECFSTREAAMAAKEKA